MQARRIARELALLSLSQYSKNPETLLNMPLEELILASVRTLTDYATTNLRHSIPDLLKVKEYLDDTEINSPKNLESAMDADMRPVKLPNSKELRDHVDSMMVSVDYIMDAIEIAETTALAKQSEVKEFAIRIIKTYIENMEDVDKIIDEHSKGWPVDRMLKLDLNILRIAITEILYMADIPPEVAADEAVELAKKYCSKESPRFINGIVGQVIEHNKR